MKKESLLQKGVGERLFVKVNGDPRQISRSSNICQIGSQWILGLVPTVVVLTPVRLVTSTWHHSHSSLS